jgi:acetaldehyde dehydrogenase (acetylating)
MTLGCGSWGGNVTSDNISPIHLLDIKRIAFETRPVTKKVDLNVTSIHVDPATKSRSSKISREKVVEIVDKFLSEKLAQERKQVSSSSEANTNPSIESPVKTIIHELKPPSDQNGTKPKPVDFVSETDVRIAIEKGEKIYIHSKTIITPAARDLGEEKEVFAKV